LAKELKRKEFYQGVMPNKSKPTSDGEVVSKLPSIELLPRDVLAPAWLAAIIESADDAIISKNLEGIISSWNKGAERIFGYTGDEVIGKPILILIPKDLQSEEKEILSKIRSGQRVEHYETVRLRKDGSLVNVSLTISPIKAPDGNIVGASKIARDISERKLAEMRLKEQHEVVETINRIGRVLSGELEQKKLVQSVTDAATELTGAEFGSFFYNVLNDLGESYMLYTLSGVPREKFSQFPMPRSTDLFGPSFRGEGTIRIDDVKKDPRYGNNAPYYGMPPGHLPVTSYLAVPVISRSGDVLGGLFFGHSEPGKFTERHERIIEGLAAQTAIAIDNARLYREAQEAIRDREELLNREQLARHQAELASRSKDEFLGLLSHELRTPLNAILGWTRMLSSTTLDQTTMTNALVTIDRNARLQSRLIEDMLDVSRIMSGKLRLDAQPVDLTSVINGAVDTLRPAADAKGIRVHVTLDFGTGSVLGDPVRLQQVVWNLLSNAVKFTPKDGSIRVSLERTKSYFEIKVADTGPGIDPEFLPYVFERFRQGDSSTTKKYGGLGLGLAIVRQLVELHGGTVEASNSETGGAVFTTRLPIMAVKSRSPIQDFQASEHDGDESLPVEFPAVLKGVKILAVDDDADSRHLLMVVLEQCGAQVRTCESVAEALEAIPGFRPDVLISDIGMPIEDGYSLIRKVRESDNYGKKIPAVALTAFARSEDRMKALSAGFNMHLPKPVEPAELMTVVASLVNRN
jgi:PAS domain S-box-containing protein